jgi:hypothetical protein
VEPQGDDIRFIDREVNELLSDSED